MNRFWVLEDIFAGLCCFEVSVLGYDYAKNYKIELGTKEKSYIGKWVGIRSLKSLDISVS